MELYEALFKRTSQRKFREEAMNEKSLNSFLSGLDSIPLLHPENNLTIRFITYGELKTLFPNYYKNFIYAPYFLFFYSENNTESMQNIGYLGQLSSLWLCCNGYGSCWQVVKGIEQTVWPEAEKLLREEAIEKEKTRIEKEMSIEIEEKRNIDREGLVYESQEKYKNKDNNVKDKENNKSEDVILFPSKSHEQILAFGIPDNRIKINRPISRKRVNSLLISGSPEPGIAFLDLLEAARTAPSEYNSQPWRFWVTDHCIHVFIKPTKIFGSKLRHENEHVAVGCMLANLITQAELSGLNVELRQEKEPFEPIRELEYVISIYVSDPYKIS